MQPPTSTFKCRFGAACLLAAAGAYLGTHGHAQPLPIPALAQAYQGRLRIGTAVEPAELAGADGGLLASQFDSVVAENVMKPSRIQPREGAFDFAPADAIAAFARRHGMAMRGHTLLWYRRTPEWFWVRPDGGPAARELVLARLRRHVEVVVGRYKAAVYGWDVVNEVIDATQPSCLRNDQWFQVVGPGYIEQAFRYAHAADPHARLFINEYSTTEPGKRACLVRVVKDLLARGVPVHGVGHQMHLSIFEPTMGEIDDALTVFARLGLENQITELDMSIYRRNAYVLSEAPERLLRIQGARYQALMRVLLAHPEVTAVTWWGLSDAHTYRNTGWNFWRSDQPLLFDAEGAPKPAFWAVLAAAPGKSAPDAPSGR